MKRQAGIIVRGCGPYDLDCRAARILRWIRTAIHFVPDPIGIEAVASPAVQLRRILADGATDGDCDDASALAASLARAVGLESRLVLASFREDRRLHHVFAQAKGKRLGWIDLDPFRTERFNRRPTRLIFVRIPS